MIVGQDGKLDALFAEYRGAFPDPEGGADFMPGLWRKIENRRMEISRTFRRLAQLFVAATVFLIVLLNTASMSSTDEGETLYSQSYVEVLAADYAADYSRVLPVGDSQ